MSVLDPARKTGTINMTYKNMDRSERGTFVNEQIHDIPGVITTRTQAALNLVNAAKAMGVLDRVLLVLSRLCGKMSVDFSDSPRPGERRQDKWRGQEREDTEYLGPTDTTTSGELSASDQRARERWRRLEAKEKQKKRRRRYGGCNRDD
ncbi:MAG TPA: hypothetical protein VM425_16360 [Myxococcota bacterium]|nr:hypothetical protein [Myxococcota bacterium]